MFINTKFIRAIAFLLIFILFNQADCSHKEKTLISISDEFKSYIVFQEGSQWIYENQTGERDTVVLKDIEEYMQESPYNVTTEAINITKVSSLYGEEKTYAQSQEINIDCDHYSIYSSVYHSPVYFFCCCEEGKKVENLKYLGNIDSLTIGAHQFYQIRHFESDSINLQAIKNFYYAKDIGLIQYQDFDKNEWKLIDFRLGE